MNVKDVPAKEFIDAFAKHLKKGNKIKMPDVRFFPLFFLIIIIFNSGLAMLRPHAPKILRHMKPIGFTLELPQSPTNYTLEERLESPP